MNPHLQTQEVKQLKFLVETQLKITNEVLQEQIQKENQNNIDILIYNFFFFKIGLFRKFWV